MSINKNRFKSFLSYYLPMEYIVNMFSSVLWKYSNIRVKLEDKYSYYYDKNSYFRNGVNSIYYIKEYITKKLFDIATLPEENSWNNFITIVEKNNEYKYIESYEILDNIVLNENQYIDNIQKINEFLNDAQNKNYSCILSKYNNTYYVRNSSIVLKNEEYFKNSTVTIISAVYSHPKMNEKIDLEISNEMLFCHNQLFNAAFVYHCLKYKNNKLFIFDKDYKIEIMDSNVELITIKYNEYLDVQFDKLIVKECN